MQQHESDQQTGDEVTNEQTSNSTREAHWWRLDFIDRAGAQFGIIIDNGGSEASALND